METKDSAVQLLKEWKRLDEIVAPLFEATEEERDFETSLVIGHFTSQMRPISRRLDEMAKAWGISLGQDGLFWYKEMLVCLGGKSHCLTGNDFRFIPAREQQAIQEWLLIKNEEKTA